MPSFIYITDIFCPWCFGFAPVMRRIVQEYAFPVRVLCGNLVDEPAQTASMGTPRLRAFFQRLSSTTGRSPSDAFFRLLEKENSVLMESSRSAVLIAAMKRLAPGNALEQMEKMQEAFYLEGLDVLSLDVQAKTASRWGVRREELEDALLREDVREKARKEMDEAEEILGDFVVYPTLFLKTDAGMLHAVARGYAPFDAVNEKLREALQEGAVQGSLHGEACGPGEACCIRHS